MIPYSELVPMKEYIIDTHCSFVGTFCHTIIANSQVLILMKVNGKIMTFFEYDRFKDVELSNPK
jgi:hypothetical protein